MRKFTNIFKPDSGAKAFFVSIIVWGVGIGCFSASLNNFLVEMYDVTEYGRGWIEFFREMPGLLLVLVLAAVHRVSEWRILRIGTMFSIVGAAGLLLPANLMFVTLMIMLWSTGEHLVMPVRSSIAMQVAKPGKGGESLGYVTSAMNAGTVAGSILVALIFYLGIYWFGAESRLILYYAVWFLIVLLMATSIISTFAKNAPMAAAKRPRLYFSKKYNTFYVLELFYGARKQVFLTFAPFVLIKNYGLHTGDIALLMGICAAVNIFGSPLVGKITDRIGYRNVMIYDTVILFFVCIVYGFAGSWFPPQVALWVVCANYLLDAVISTASLATNLYLRDISSSRDELTSSLTTGISINHLISVTMAPLGGWIWQQFGLGVLFGFAAAMAVGNSIVAATLPRFRKPESE